jgi:hypothetical protein
VTPPAACRPYPKEVSNVDTIVLKYCGAGVMIAAASGPARVRTRLPLRIENKSMMPGGAV